MLRHMAPLLAAIVSLSLVVPLTADAQSALPYTLTAQGTKGAVLLHGGPWLLGPGVPLSRWKIQAEIASVSEVSITPGGALVATVRFTAPAGSLQPQALLRVDDDKDDDKDDKVKLLARTDALPRYQGTSPHRIDRFALAVDGHLLLAAAFPSRPNMPQIEHIGYYYGTPGALQLVIPPGTPLKTLSPSTSVDQEIVSTEFTVGESNQMAMLLRYIKRPAAPVKGSVESTNTLLLFQEGKLKQALTTLSADAGPVDMRPASIVENGRDITASFRAVDRNQRRTASAHFAEKDWDFFRAGDSSESDVLKVTPSRRALFASGDKLYLTGPDFKDPSPVPGNIRDRIRLLADDGTLLVSLSDKSQVLLRSPQGTTATYSPADVQVYRTAQFDSPTDAALAPGGSFTLALRLIDHQHAFMIRDSARGVYVLTDAALAGALNSSNVNLRTAALLPHGHWLLMCTQTDNRQVQTDLRILDIDLNPPAR